MADETTPQAPQADPYSDREKIAQRVRDRFKEWDKGRERFTWAAWRNILFYQGNQWIEHDRMSPTGWRPARVPAGMPKPVTNRFARVMDAHVSMLARFEPSLTFAPGSQDAEDRAAADVATRATDVISEEVELTTHRQQLAKWVGLTGGAWRETGYDTDPVHGTVPTLVNACAACGYMEPPSVEAPQPPAPMEPEMDPNTGMALPETGPMPDPMMMGTPCPQCGAPMTEQTVPMPRGKMFVDVVSLFEMFFDPSIPDWTKQPGCLRQKAVSLDKAKARWKQDIDPNQIKADSMGGTGQDYMASLATLGPQVDDSGRQMLLSQRGTNTKVTENYYYELPCEDYPDGLLVVMLGKKPEHFVKAGPLPYAYDNDDGSRTPFLPYVFFPQNEVPGSAWPKTVANDIAPKQAQRNNYEAYVMAWAKRMANAVWVVGQGSNVRNLTGQMGQIIEWNTTLGAHGKPSREAGQPITPGIVEMMQRIDHEMDEIAIVSEVMSGNRPAGISAGIALQILKERGETQFGPMFVKWNHAEAQWARQALAIAKQFWTEERLRKIKGRDGEWEVQKFLGSDLRAGIDVLPEAGVAMPKSTMTDRAEAAELVQMGAINMADPDAQIAMLRLFGKQSLFRPTMEKDAKRAIMENEAFRQLAADPRLAQLNPALLMAMQAETQMIAASAGPVAALASLEMKFAEVGVPLPKLKPAIDGHAIHAKEHRDEAKGEGFDKWPPVVQFIFEVHISAHDFMQGQQMMALAQANPKGSSGFTQAPGPDRGSPASTPAERGGSSPRRLDGDAAELERMGGRSLG
jgi:hypothetical protein